MKPKKLFALIVSSMTFFCLLFVNVSFAATSFTPSQKKEIQKIVHDYLLSDPEVLLQASVALRKKMEEKQQSKALTAIKANKEALFDNSKDPVAGNPNGTITMVEFFDYQCPHCKVMSPVINSLIDTNKNLKVVFKEWPIFGGSSLDAAKAAIAAMKQGKYYPLHEALLAAKNPMTKEIIFQKAKDVGLNIAKLKRDMDSPETMKQIKANFSLARQLQLVGTPAFVLTNKAQTKFEFIPGQTSKENLQHLIKKLS